MSGANKPRKSPKLLFKTIFALLLVFGILAGANVYFLGSILDCKYTISTMTKSPLRSRTLVKFEKVCFTDGSVQYALYKSKFQLYFPSYFESFVAVDNREKIDARWLTEDEIEVKTSAATELYSKYDSIDGVKIRYVTE